MNGLNKLEAWHKVEYLTPYVIETDSSNRYRIDKEQDIPWVNQEKNGCLDTKQHTYIHRVFIGVVAIEKELEEIRRHLSHIQVPQGIENKDGYTALGEVRVSNRGEYMSDSLSVSAMPFGVKQMKHQDKYEHNWAKLFQEYRDEMKEVVQRQFNNKTVTLAGLQRVLASMMDWLNWQPKFSVKPFWSDAHKIKKSTSKSKEEKPSSEQEVGILNSFFARDLETVLAAVKEQDIGRGLHQFLNGENMADHMRLDIDENSQHLPELLSPEKIPLGKWPGKDKYHLSLMQQAAVNTMLNRQAIHNGIFSVNGPPGTGKTTLLRDVMAAIITERAIQLVDYDHPERAFSKLISIPVNSNYTVHVQKPDTKICGYGMVVASSNNNAVENISAELPDLENVDEAYRDHPGAHYFREVKNQGQKENDWGFFAAVLGNSKNRTEFTNTYLSNWKRTQSPKDGGGAQAGISLQASLDKVKVTRQDWDQARAAFRQAKKHVEKEREQAIYIQKRVAEVEQYRHQLVPLQSEEQKLREQLHEHSVKKEELEIELHQVNRELQSIEEVWSALQLVPFSWWQKLLRSKPYREHLAEKQQVAQTRVSLQKQKKQLHDHVQSINRQEQQAQTQLADIKTNISKLQANIEDLKQIVDRDGRTVIDDRFWELPYAERQQFAPWMSISFANARATLFLEAMRVHEIFIRMAKKPMKNALNAFANLHQIDTYAYPEAVKPIWDTFFLVVPVVSTAFASVSSMFKGMGRESLDWLFIDEAGQAVPQAAVGAIWRAKQTVAVGDPLQVEPVVTTPESVLRDIADHHDVSVHYVSKTASVQTVADLANPYGKWMQSGGNDFWIGCPLWVHRRCRKPMFTIANEIAYNGSMVYATVESQKSIESMLDPAIRNSHWIDVQGKSQAKHYVPAQGQEVARIIRSCFRHTPANDLAEHKLPSVYVISPFKSVAIAVKKRLWQEYAELKKMNVNISSSIYNKWVKDSVGTVHTFQGKEAELVIFCLGVDEDQKGAANWATRVPNLVNVAVTRAKKRLLVVGDVSIWAELPYMEIVKRELAVESVQFTGGKVY